MCRNYMQKYTKVLKKVHIFANKLSSSLINQ